MPANPIYIVYSTNWKPIGYNSPAPDIRFALPYSSNAFSSSHKRCSVYVLGLCVSCTILGKYIRLTAVIGSQKRVGRGDAWRNIKGEQVVQGSCNSHMYHDTGQGPCNTPMYQSRGAPEILPYQSKGYLYFSPVP